MAVVLEVGSGPFAGKRVAVKTGQTVTVGRSTRASFAVPHDTFMSSLHFAIECGPHGPRIIDQGSANGTFLNGTRVAKANLSSGDQVRAGETPFAVLLVANETAADSGEPVRSSAGVAVESDGRRAPVKDVMSTRPAPPDPRPPEPRLGPSRSRGKTPLLKVGNWEFFAVPNGWEVKDGFGIQREEPGKFPSAVTVTDEALGGGLDFQPFVEMQISMLRQYLRDATIEAAMSPAIPGAEEKACFDVRFSTRDGQILFYRRLYVRAEKTVGTITLTALESELEQIRPAFEAILADVQFQSKKTA